MKILSVVAILLSSCGLILAQTSTGSTPAPKRSDAEQIVAIVLADNASTPAYGLSFIEKHLHRMGDQVALGVFQYLGARVNTVAEDSLSPLEMRMILYIVRKSFQYPELIQSEENRSPKATMVLLRYLGSLGAARAERDELERTTTFIEQIKLSASAQ
jgi:hypothetical protein